MTGPDPSRSLAYATERLVGRATVTVVSDGELHWAPRFPVPDTEWRRAMPEADESGRLWFGLNSVLIQLGEAVIVVDPGLDEPGSTFERNFVRYLGVSLNRSPGLVAALPALGVAPEAVTHVIITHAHGDHYAGVVGERDGELTVRFARARHLIGRADWDDNPDRRLPTSDLNRRLGAVDRLGLLEPVAGETEVVPGVTLLPTPGETPGHLVVRVRSADETLYLLGDLVHHACEVAHLDWAPPRRDLTALRASRERIFAAAAREQALAVPAHERFPPWGRIVHADGGYRWERA